MLLQQRKKRQDLHRRLQKGVIATQMTAVMTRSKTSFTVTVILLTVK